MTEQELRAEARRTVIKLRALDWLDEKSKGIPKEHNDSCDYLDDTGHPAPCSCGFSKNEDVQMLRFLREAILK